MIILYTVEHVLSVVIYALHQVLMCFVIYVTLNYTELL